MAFSSAVKVVDCVTTTALATAVTSTSSATAMAPSFAVRRSLYVPAASNVAVVLAAAGFAKTAEPGPLTLLQVSVSGPGRPSS